MTTVAAPPIGTIVVDGDQATLSFRRHFDHPVNAVWAAIADPAHRAAWFGATTVDARPGGNIEMDPDDPPVPANLKHMTGRILTWDPPAVFEHTWHQIVVGEGAVRYDLAADGDGTLLTFTHRGLSVPNATGFIPGTHAYLDRLEAHLAGEPVPGWQARYAALAPLYGVTPRAR